MAKQPLLVHHPDSKDERRQDRYCLLAGDEPALVWIQVTPFTSVGIYVSPDMMDDKLGTTLSVHTHHLTWGSTFTPETARAGCYRQWTEELPLGSDYKAKVAEAKLKQYRPVKKQKVMVRPISVHYKTGKPVNQVHGKYVKFKKGAAHAESKTPEELEVLGKPTL